MPYWLGALLVLTHVAIFVLGAVAYHGIRMLSIRPMFTPGAKAAPSDAKLMQMAEAMVKKQMGGVFQHFDRFSGEPVTPRSQVIPDGDGRSREETFSPVVPGVKR